MEKEKCICETESVKLGCILKYRIKDKYLELQYESSNCDIDSDFGFKDTGIEIKFCPFCGRKL